MKDMETYFRKIKKQYPQTMSKDQFYQVAHISKATALYLLMSGVVPCKDTGKKTRRYTIQTDDVIEYIRQRELHPERYKAIEGWYAGTAGNKKISQTNYWMTLTPEQTKKFEDFFRIEMEGMPDLLTVKEIATFAGYEMGSVIKWCNSAKLRAFRVAGKFLIPKECAIEYLASPAMCHSFHKSCKYKLFITEFRKRHKLES